MHIMNWSEWRPRIAEELAMENTLAGRVQALGRVTARCGGWVLLYALAAVVVSVLVVTVTGGYTTWMRPVHWSGN